MKWILASERLPDKGGMYFVKCYHEEYLDNIVKASVQINSSGEYFFNNPFFKILEWLDESPLVDHPKEVYIPVPVSSELPEDDDKESVGRMRFSKTVPVITGVQEHQIVAAYYDYGNTTWYEYESGDKIFPTHWLKKATTPIVQGYSEDTLRAAISAGLSIGYSPNYKLENREQEIQNILSSLPQSTSITK